MVVSSCLYVVRVEPTHPREEAPIPHEDSNWCKFLSVSSLPGGLDGDADTV